MVTLSKEGDHKRRTTLSSCVYLCLLLELQSIMSPNRKWQLKRSRRLNIRHTASVRSERSRFWPDSSMKMWVLIVFPLLVCCMITYWFLCHTWLQSCGWNLCLRWKAVFPLEFKRGSILAPWPRILDVALCFWRSHRRIWTFWAYFTDAENNDLGVNVNPARRYLKTLTRLTLDHKRD